MGYAEERSAIESHLAANWTATPIAWPNVAFEPGTAAAWIQPRIVNVQSFQASLGSPAVFRHPGAVSINVWIRPQTGTAAARTYADQLAQMFRSLQIGSITFHAPAVNEIGD